MHRPRAVVFIGTLVLVGTIAVGCAAPSPVRVVAAASATRPQDAKPVIDAPNAAGLDASDAALVDAIGARIATKAGTPVRVVRAIGAAAWNALSPDVDNGPSTSQSKHHPALVVSGTANLNSDSRLGDPEDPRPVEDGEIIVVIDATTGAIVETIHIPAGSANPWAAELAGLGPSTTVILSEASFADHP
jgi:hypothetical protein